jgi:hypothetical protein
LLWLYPAAFRRTYGREMVQFFRDVSLEIYEQHRLAGILYWWGSTLFDLVLTAIQQRSKTMAAKLRHAPIKGSGLGIMTTMGGIFYFVGGLWLIAGGVPTDRFAIQIIELLKMMWASGMICGLMGMAVLGALSNRWFSHGAAWLAGLGLVEIAISGLYGVINPPSISLYTYTALPFSPSQFLVLIGWSGVSVAVLTANRWQGWTRFVPSVALFAPFIGMIISAYSTVRLVPMLTMGVALALLGLALMTHLHEARRLVQELEPA